MDIKNGTSIYRIERFYGKGVFILFSFLAGIIEQLQSLKTKADKNRYQKLKKQKLKQYMAQGMDYSEAIEQIKRDPDLKEEKEELNKQKIKDYIFKAISAIIAFVESAILSLTALLGGVGVLVVITVGVIIIVIIGIISPIDLNKGKTDLNDISKSSSSATAAWTEEELSVRGVLLNDYEKNLYRLIMLSKQTVNGTYANTVFTGDVGIDTMFLVGTSSTETGMQFYAKSSDNRNILQYPSDYAENNLGYGMLGLNASKKVEDYYGTEIAAKLKAKYVPLAIPLTDARYIPWGVAMSGKHLSNDMSATILTEKTDAVITKVMQSYGITANAERFKKISYWVCAQAEYHGAQSSEYEAYISFLGAMWAASSDDDTKRDLANYTYTNGEGTYGEGAFRHVFVGSNGAQDIELNGDFTNIQYYTRYKTRIALNGVELPKPVWGYLHDKYKDNPEFMIAENQMKSFASMVTNDDGGGTGMRVLNFHYGINSFIQGTALMKNISGKLIGGSDSAGDNHTIKEVTGLNTLKNMMATATKPLGRCMYSWGGGRDPACKYFPPIGFSPKWEQFYKEQQAKGTAYSYKDYVASNGNPTDSTRSNGLDCSGFIGWIVYNTRNDGYNWGNCASTFEIVLVDKGCGNLTSASKVTDYKCGDIMTNDGHIWMIVGPSEKGGIVLIHSSPNGVKLGGWGGGEATAKAYMEKYWPDVSDKAKEFNFGTFSNNGYKGDYDQFRWNIVQNGSLEGVQDPDGFRDMTAEQILKIVFME